MKKLPVCALLLIFSLLLFAGCSSGSNSASYDYTADSSEKYYAAYDVNNDIMADMDYSSSEAEGSYSGVSDTRKIVRTMNLELETKAFDDAVSFIQSSVSGAGGYIESSYVSGKSMESSGDERNASFTLRIPAESLDSYVSGLGDGFNIVSKTENSNDITDSYYDTQARLDSLETQEERLLAMLEGANELQYMLQIEETLADVRYQIESLYSTIQRYDSQVSMSTLNISLREVIEYKPVEQTPVTFAERVSKAFSESWADFADGCRDFAVGFVYALPTLLVLAAVIALLVIIIRAVVKRRRARRVQK